MKANAVAKSIRETLVYFDIFDYPLTFYQLHQYVGVKISKKKLKEELKKTKNIGKTGSFYHLKKRTPVVFLRKKKERFYREKIILTKKLSAKLIKIPTVQLIGVSGALAMGNCGQNDDIDLFIITKSKTLWTTRLAILFILQLLGKRRTRDEKNVSNKICLNMLLDERNLALAKKRQNVYGAHEVMQMIPLFERRNTYNRFIIANSWCFSFFPNIRPNKILITKKGNGLSSIIQVLEPFSRYVQKKYMKTITKEEVSDTLLAFHPNDYQSKTLLTYKRKLRALV